MSNRALRRTRNSRIAKFRGTAKVLHTSLLETCEIDRHPQASLFHKAATFWRSCHNKCFVCDEELVAAAAFLFAAGNAPRTAAVAGMCCRCWARADRVDIERRAIVVLRQI